VGRGGRRRSDGGALRNAAGGADGGKNGSGGDVILIAIGVKDFVGDEQTREWRKVPIKKGGGPRLYSEKGAIAGGLFLSRKGAPKIDEEGSGKGGTARKKGRKG